MMFREDKFRGNDVLWTKVQVDSSVVVVYELEANRLSAS